MVAQPGVVWGVEMSIFSVHFFFAVDFPDLFLDDPSNTTAVVAASLLSFLFTSSFSLRFFSSSSLFSRAANNMVNSNSSVCSAEKGVHGQ